MDIRRHAKTVFFAIALPVFMTGCSILTAPADNADTLFGIAENAALTYMHNHDQETSFEDTYIDERYETDHFFFGTWLLERVVANIQIVGDERQQRYLYPNAEDFLGFELEIAADFVRLGDRILTWPQYNMSRRESEFNSLFFPEHEWESAFYCSPDEFYEAMREHGIELGRVDDDFGKIYFEIVLVSYLIYPEIRSPESLEIIDPDTLNDEQWVLLSPLFQRCLILNDDYMLIGRSELVLARRVG